MSYIIFKTTHRATGRYFIGKIIASKWTCSGRLKYGSGRDIMSLVKQHGVAAFDRIELKRFKDGDQALAFKNSQIDIRDPLCINVKENGWSGNTGHPQSKAARNKIKEAMTGKPAPNKGIPMRQEQKDKLSIAKTGTKASPETCAKISKAQTGRKHKPETIEKIRVGNLGKFVSQETRDKISSARTGHKASPQAKKNMSIAQTKRHAKKRAESE